jgi:DNA mismatch repair protein MutS2
VEETFREPAKRRQQVVNPKSEIVNRKLQVGDKVTLRTLGTPGTVMSINEDEAEVQAGALRMRVPLEELKRKEEELEAVSSKSTARDMTSEPQSKIVNRKSEILSPSPGLELDLRGQRAEDALDRLDSYLEKAYMSGLPYVRIIHGKGTGKLRQEVRAMLKDHPHVLSFEEGGDKEGGSGVTVAKLAG